MKRWILVLLLFLSACSVPPRQAPQYLGSWTSEQQGNLQEEDIPTTSWLQLEAEKVLTALAENNFQDLAVLIDTEQWVRFSPYGDFGTWDRILKPEDLIKEDNAVYTWGNYAGNGEPIELSKAAYFEQFVYPVDFLHAPEVLINTITDRGGVIVNIEEAFPNAEYIQYFFPGFREELAGMDREGLYLIFDKKTKKLIGIAHEVRTG